MPTEEWLRNFFETLIKISKKHFDTHFLKIWHICACRNRDFALLHTFDKFLVIIWVETYSGDTLWYTKLVNYFINLIAILVYKLHNVLRPNLLCPNFNCIACAEVGIWSKELQTRKYLQKKPFDHIYDVIYIPHLSRNILSVSVQLMSNHEICKLYILTRNRADERMCQVLNVGV